MNTVMIAIARNECKKIRKESYSLRLLTDICGRGIQGGVSKNQMR